LLDLADGAKRVALSVPAGATLNLRAPAAAAMKVEAGAGLAPLPGDAKAAPGLRRFAIKADATLTVTATGGAGGRFDIAAIAPAPPKVTLQGAPKPDRAGGLALAYAIEDAYGVTQAHADVTAPRVDGAPTHGKPLVGPPAPGLSLGAKRGGLGPAHGRIAATSSPWAGAEATLRVAVKDTAGLVGESAPVAITLPERAFVVPLARALVELRRDLALDPGYQRERVALALDALGRAPERFTPQAGVYLALTGIERGLVEARTDDDLRGIVDALWTLATRIEDGDAHGAAQALRDVERRLREALARGASDKEIAALTAELKAAVQRYLERLAKNAPKGAAPPGGAVDSRDLGKMIDAMREAARGGSRAQAQAMLDRLQGLLDDLKGAQVGQADPLTQQMQRGLGELDKMMRDQGKLRDDTFAGKPQDGQSLAQRQRALRDQLDALREALRKKGVDAPPALGDAEKAMGEAQRALQGLKPGQAPGQGRGSLGEGGQAALDAQGRALEAMRRAANGLARTLAQRQGNGRGQGVGRVGQGRTTGRGTGAGLPDPLGRQDSTGTYGERVQIGPSPADRARKLLDDLRRRSADPNRPGGELRYYGRLLDGLN
ncbi:MAG: DUF4175 family protein, partial [Hyphomicrobiales bacterium]|nr:DUF4175 family protein [Hyphomicrobiales bacterium]